MPLGEDAELVATVDPDGSAPKDDGGGGIRVSESAGSGGAEGLADQSGSDDIGDGIRVYGRPVIVARPACL